jgi:hypothetical protein
MGRVLGVIARSKYELKPVIETIGLPPKEWRAFLIGFLRIRGA